jgi:hypothetical protein
MNAMKKLIVAGIMGTVLMVTAGTQMAAAAPWRGAYRGHVYGRPAYRTAFVHRPVVDRFYGHRGFYGRCW